MKKILVTGGAGLIGSSIIDILLKNKFKVFVLDNLSTGRLENISRECVSKINFYKGSILDKNLVNKLVKNVDFIYHLAASVGLKNILSNRVDSINTNVLGSHNIIHACSEYNKKLVIASSSEVYGINKKKKLLENDLHIIGNSKKFRWSYSVSKLLEEHIALAYKKERKLKVNIVRFFNTVGPKQSSLYGMVIPNFVESALRNKDLLVFGGGKQTRTFLHVKDAAEVLYRLIKIKKYGQIFNVGGKENISIYSLALKIINLSNSKSKINKIDYKFAYSKKKIFSEDYQDIPYRHPDISLLKKKLNFSPSISLKKILLETIEFKKLLM
jgi:UDP-glucose 4-epimerase